MAGIVFFKTCVRKQLIEFYTSTFNMLIWLEQADCTILQHGNLLLGFCSHDEIERAGIITFVYTTKKEVDQKYQMLKNCALDSPKINTKYQIYHFFAHDPEKRLVEIQAFLHPVKSWNAEDV